VRLVLALAAFVGLVACTQPRSARCKQICALEAECVERTSTFEEKECVAACAVLEADQQSLARVVSHAECVTRNQNACQAMLACP
jgi:hypothetical protein